jgi:hypothetical protein
MLVLLALGKRHVNAKCAQLSAGGRSEALGIQSKCEWQRDDCIDRWNVFGHALSISPQGAWPMAGRSRRERSGKAGSGPAARGARP